MRFRFGSHRGADFFLLGSQLFDRRAFLVSLGVRLLELVEQLLRGLGIFEQINQAAKGRQAVGPLVKIIEAHGLTLRWICRAQSKRGTQRAAQIGLQQGQIFATANLALATIQNCFDPVETVVVDQLIDIGPDGHAAARSRS